jgi:hypothetical protein
MSDGGAALTERGTCWGASAAPVTNCAAEGGTSTGVFFQVRTGLTAGAKLYYRGYATNSTGTGYTPDGSFYTEPSAQASSVNFTGVGQTGMTVNWTRGSGDGVIVLMRSGSAVNADPADGAYTAYAASAGFGGGTQIGSGNYVIYKGTGASVPVTGLIAGTAYYVATYEYTGTVDTSGTDQGTNYRSTPATGSQLTSAPVVPVLVAPTATGLGTMTATLGANITSNGGASLTARGTCWNVTTPVVNVGVGGNNCAAEGGTATGVFSQARTGLNAGSIIYYKGYATNSAGTGYSTEGSFYTEPATQASLVSFSSITTTSFTVNWTRGSGDGVLVLMRSGSAVNAGPQDGTYTGYAASAVFGGGTQIGSGNYVVYKGAGTGVTVTGLAPGTTYYAAVYEFKGTVNTSGANQGTNYGSVPATASQMTGVVTGSYSYTFNYTGSVQTLTIPAGAINILFTVKGAGGGGGRNDYASADNGVNGHLVTRPSSTPGVVVSIYVGGGGIEGSSTDAGSPGGWGYHAGGYGGDGEYWDDYCWAYGGAGGGGSSAILVGVTVLAEAAGGAGGRSGDWECAVAGSGGVGGGSDYPATTDPTGGGAGGLTAAPDPGGNGQVVILYDVL